MARMITTKTSKPTPIYKKHKERDFIFKKIDELPYGLENECLKYLRNDAKLFRIETENKLLKSELDLKRSTIQWLLEERNSIRNELRSLEQYVSSLEIRLLNIRNLSRDSMIELDEFYLSRRNSFEEINIPDNES